MNELIKKLVERSGGDLWQRIESDGVLNKEAYVSFDPPEKLEKFTELIVEECADICNRMYFDTYPDAEDYERSAEADAIKKHFGIKQ
jgi:hypothetical protein